MEVLGHDNVSHNYEAIASASFFKDREEAVTTARTAKLRLSVMTGAGDKVQVMSAISTMQSGGHDSYGTSVCGTRPCKERKDGAPTFQNGKEKQERKGGPPAKLAVSDGFNASGTQTCKYGDPTASIAGYDDLGRLISANCGSIWSQSFSYDPFGNITKSGTSAWAPGYNQANNHYVSPATYDAAGHVLYDTIHNYTWNVYGRPATIDGTTTLTYDANDVLVEKGVSGAYTEFEYGPTGRTCTMNGTAQVQCVTPLPGGSALARGPETIWHPDWLGTPRLGSSPSNRTITFDRAFAPFGEQYNTITGGTTNLAFTGLLQDPVSGEYDTPARLLHPGQGRWISPDPAGIAAVDPGNPQSWNRYAYVTNNPLSLVDPSGLDGCNGGSGPWNFDFGCGGTYDGGYLGVSCNMDGDYCMSDSQAYQMFEQSILPGENSINFPMGTGNLFGDIWDALGLPSGLSCPDVGGASSFLCGGVNPIMDARPDPCAGDPVFGALEFKFKAGPEVELGPTKVGISLYKNVTTGDTGASIDADAGFFGIGGDNQADGSSLNIGGPNNIRWSGNFLGFNYDFASHKWKFAPSKSFKFGFQALLGGELSFNADTYKKISAQIRRCREAQK